MHNDFRMYISENATFILYMPLFPAATVCSHRALQTIVDDLQQAADIQGHMCTNLHAVWQMYNPQDTSPSGEGLALKKLYVPIRMCQQEAAELCCTQNVASPVDDIFHYRHACTAMMH